MPYPTVIKSQQCYDFLIPPLIGIGTEHQNTRSAIELTARCIQVAAKVCLAVSGCLLSNSLVSLLIGGSPFLHVPVGVFCLGAAALSFDIARVADNIASIFSSNYAERLSIRIKGPQEFINTVTKNTHTGIPKLLGTLFLLE